MKKLMKIMLFELAFIALLFIAAKPDRAGAAAKSTDTDIFEYDGAVYKVTSKKNHSAMLVKSRPLTDYDGKCYEQESMVYKDDEEYTVTSIGYKAFSEDGIKCSVQVKLPSTIKEIKSECMGVNIVSLDMSETAVKTVPAYVFVTYSGIKDITPAVSEVILPKNCKTIEGYAFYKCNNIKAMVIPEKVKKIGTYIIPKSCTSLTFEGKVPKGVKNQPLTGVGINVKSEYYVEVLELLVKKVSLGQCVINEIK